MPEELKTGSEAAAKTTEEVGSALEELLGKVDVPLPTKPVDADKLVNYEDANKSDMMTLALNVFFRELGRSSKVEKVDKVMIDRQIARIDEVLSEQLDEILHHEDFQKLESAWRGLKFLIDRTDFRKNIKLEVLQIGKTELLEDFEDAPEVVQTGLYKHVYKDEYDTPGGEPYGAIIGNYYFGRMPQDIALLQNLAKVSASCHAPFLSAVNASFFGKEDLRDLTKIPDPAAIFESVDYIKWNSFRKTEDARYLGLTFPKVLTRLPYGPDTVPVKAFDYHENVKGEDHNKYCWGNAAFAMATNLTRSFADNGWCVQIRGPQSGGTVENLPIHLYDAGGNKQAKIPSEVLITDTDEFSWAKQGLIPLSYYKGRDYACFFSAQSTQEPQKYSTPEATANSRISARLPYVFLVSRLAHYMKVIQRENIGATKDKTVLENELNTWIKRLVTETKNPSPDIIAKHPLRAAEVRVHEIADNPGFYRVEMLVMPHFQIEGMDIGISLVAQMPKGK
jgi:type VI secretion system protein ImpC